MRASLAEVAGAPADGPERADVADYGVRLDALIVAVAGSLRSLRADLAQDTPTFVNRADGLDPMIDALVGLRAELPRVIDTPRDPAVAEVFSLTTHQRLMGKELAHAATLRDGLARLVWSWLLARSLMIRRARRARRFHVTGDDAMDAVATLTFLHRTEPVKRLLDAHAEALASLCVDELPTLVAHAAELALRDDRVELVSF